jgi:hypothetical protein
MEEIFKTHDNFEELQFSNLGRIKHNNKIYLPYTSKSTGYQRITHNKKVFSFHRIIADLFCEKQSEDKIIVDHINGLRDDNRADNLRWVNYSENNSNRRRDGVITKECLNKKNNVNIDNNEFYKKQYELMFNLYKNECAAHEKTFNTHMQTLDLLNEIQKKYE